MDLSKVGQLIRARRLALRLTQRELADVVGVSDKAVSKWERALGCPDVTLLGALSAALGVDIASILAGEMPEKERDGGNMKRIRFFTCPACGNILTATGDAQIACCGHTLAPLEARPCDEAHRVRIEPMDGELYMSFDHEMTKEHFVHFVACVTSERALIVRLYPEQGGELRMPHMPWATYYVCCNRDGLFTTRVSPSVSQGMRR